MALVIRNKDQHQPETFKEKLLAGATASGVAWVEDGKIECYSENSVPTPKSIKDNEEAFNFKSIYWVGSRTSKFEDDDLQPFKLVVNADGTDVIVGFADGDFEAFKNATHSNEYQMMNDVMLEKVNAVYDENDGDLTKTMAALALPTFRDSLKATLHPRGTILLMAINGDINEYSNNKLGSSFPWGHTTNTFGYTEQAPGAPAPADTGKKLTPAERLAAQRAGKGSVPAVTPTDTRIPPTAGTDKTADGDPIQYPPEEYLAEKNATKLINKWWNRNFGQNFPRPKGWETGKVGSPFSKLLPNAPLRSRKGDPAKADGVSDTIPPILAPAQIEKMRATFFKDLNEKNPSLLNLADFNQIEEDYATVADQCDIPFNLLIRDSLKRKREMIKDFPQAGYNFLVDVCTRLVKLDPSVLEPSKPEITKEPIPGDDTKKVVAPDEKLTPAQRLAAQRAAKAA